MRKVATRTASQNRNTLIPTLLMPIPTAIFRDAWRPTAALPTIPATTRTPHRGPGYQGRSAAKSGASVWTAYWEPKPIATIAPQMSRIVDVPATYMELRVRSRVRWMVLQPSSGVSAAVPPSGLSMMSLPSWWSRSSTTVCVTNHSSQPKFVAQTVLVRVRHESPMDSSG